MSGSALDRLFNSVETQKKPSRTPSLEEQLLEDDEDNEALFLDGMSESSRKSLMAKVAEASGQTEDKEPKKMSKIEKVTFTEEVEETDDPVEDTITVDETTGEVIDEPDKVEPIKQEVEDEETLDIERPAEKPATAEEMKILNSSQEKDVADELVQPTKSKRGRKPKVKQDQLEVGNTNMEEKQVSLPTSSVGTIMNVLGVTMLQDLLKSNYTFREFGKEDTALIIKHLLSNLKGDK